MTATNPTERTWRAGTPDGPWILELIAPGQLATRRAAEPAYLLRWDPDAHEVGRPYPSGIVELTEDPELAAGFPDAGAALEEWKRPSDVVPRRPDGAPNRPMTAFTSTPTRRAEAAAKTIVK